MTRVRLVNETEASPELKEIYDKLTTNGARVLNVYRTLGHNPALLQNFMRFGNTLLTKAELPAKLREMAILRIARLCGSEYEWAQHYAVALETGVTKEQAEEVAHWSSAACFSDVECAVLQYTDEVARNIKVKDETFLHIQQHLSERSIVELTMSIGFWGMVARLLVPLQVDIDIRTAGSAQDLTGRRT